MNKIQQIFGLDPEYNKKMEEQARCCILYLPCNRYPQRL